MIDSKAFRPYDYGSGENVKRYGTKVPPEYDLTKIDVPIALFSGSQDKLADPTDVALLKKQLSPSCIVHEEEISE